MKLAKKRIKIILLFGLIFMGLLVGSSSAYCNETQTITHSNQSLASSDYNITITRACTAEYGHVSSIAIIIFILALIIGLFILPLKITFTEIEIANNAIKNSFWLLALLLLSLSTAMLATIADNAGLELTREIFRFMWLINWGCYLFMVYLVLSFFFGTLNLWKENTKKKRMGEP